ncbi:MAG TPA: 4-hydroxy-3-methylbut-2-enyl diphosphate reductase [Candidatus Omnitrophota bacterium]|nr:4-hydroxy-3-methylbut-2-enyl diphosphate reductase [Candidatus Omnitrophota bacterium]
MRVKLARHTGFCAGVKRAISITEKTLEASDDAVYCLGAIIHNAQVMARLQSRNLVQVDSPAKVPAGSKLILPSHGSPHKVRSEARRRRIRLIDVMCPYVSSVHAICSRIRKAGMKVVIIGDKDHPEVRALAELAPDASIISDIGGIRHNAFCACDVGIISQTTQSREKFLAMVSGILEKNPKVRSVHIYNTICLDTSCRQEEVRDLARSVDQLLVIGSRSSANTNRLYNIGRRINRRTYLVESAASGVFNRIGRHGTVGIISGASAPDWLVQQIVRKLKEPR